MQCGSPFSFLFFISYTCIITFVVLNLVIAVILEGFEDSTKSDEKVASSIPSVVIFKDYQNVVNKCIDVWKQFDPHYDVELPIDSAVRPTEVYSCLMWFQCSDSFYGDCEF